MSSGEADGPIRADLYNLANEVRPASSLVLMLWLPPVSHHRRVQRASQGAKWPMSSVQDEFPE